VRCRPAGSRPSIPATDGRKRWREDTISRLLDTGDAEVLFVTGCEENQARFHPRVDLIILLSSPAEVLAGDWPRGRRTCSAGRSASWGASWMTCNPLSRLRQAATHEIRAVMPLSDVVTQVLHLAGGQQ